MPAYKKRLTSGWRQGKRYKGDGEERQFSKTEIKQQLAEAEESYLDRHHKGARTKNIEARLTYRIRWYEKYVADWEARGTSSSMMSYFRSSLARAKKDLADHLAKKKGQV